VNIPICKGGPSSETTTDWPTTLNVSWPDSGPDEKSSGPIEVLKDRSDHAPLRILSMAVGAKKDTLSSVAFVIGWAHCSESDPVTLLLTTESLCDRNHSTNTAEEIEVGVDGGKVWVVEKASTKDLVSGAARVIRLVDPDIVTGYQVASNDFARLFQCSDNLSLPDVKAISRMRDCETSIKKFQTYGGRWVRQGRRMSHISNEESSYLKNLHGRVLLDVKKIVQGAQKLETYTIRSSASAVLGEDSPHTQALTLALECWETVIARARASFAMLRKFEAIHDTVELGRATGLSLESVWTKGQLARVWSLLLRSCRKQNVLVTDRIGGGRGSTPVGSWPSSFGLCEGL